MVKTFSHYLTRRKGRFYWFRKDNCWNWTCEVSTLKGGKGETARVSPLFFLLLLFFLKWQKQEFLCSCLFAICIQLVCLRVDFLSIYAVFKAFYKIFAIQKFVFNTLSKLLYFFCGNISRFLAEKKILHIKHSISNYFNINYPSTSNTKLITENKLHKQWKTILI